MGFNITITIKGVKNLKRIGDIIAGLVEEATNQKVNLILRDVSKLNQKKIRENQEIQKKLNR